MNAIDTKHHLDFEACEWESMMGIDEDFTKFRIGTCEGLWRSTDKTYDILVIDNLQPGNGHLEDVFQWFEYSCKRDKKNLRVLECWNKHFKMHLIRKRGFSTEGKDNVVKHYKKMI
jgi:hypothetical protein